MKVAEILNKIYRILLVTIFVLMFIATDAQVIFRYFIGYPLGWTEEFSRIMFIWSAFLTVGLLAAKDKLIKVDLVLTMLPSGLRNWINVVIKFLSGFFIVWLGILGVKLLDLAKYQLSPALRIPYWCIYLSLPLGMFIAGSAMFTQSFTQFKMIIKERGVEK